MIKVMIVDDQALIREGLQMILSLYNDIDIVGEAFNGQHALDIIKNINPDVVLMDIRMPIMDGVEATKIIKEKYPHIKVIILTTFNEDEYIFEGLKNGADGYILKDIKSEEIVKAIKEAYKGNVLLQPEVAKKVVKSFNNLNKNNKLTKQAEFEDLLKDLTQREIEIAKLIAEGKSNKEISRELFITEGTVKNHLTRILNKLELKNRTQLALLINNKINKWNNH